MSYSLNDNRKEIFNPTKNKQSTLKTMQQLEKKAVQVMHRKAECTSVFETISLFSVDQIRERESPWKALTDTALDIPGQQRNDRSIKRSSPFKQRLQERKKICMLYGDLSKRLLDRYLKGISRPEDLIFLLESRLDIVLKRSSLFPCIQNARRSILQGCISVNHQIVRSPRYHCTPGDVIKVLDKQGYVPKSVAGVLLPHNLSKRENTGSIHKKDRTLNVNEWDNIFAFSERLKTLDRKAGRLHTSVLQVKSKQDVPPSGTQLGSARPLRVKGISLMPLHRPIPCTEEEIKKHTNRYRLGDKSPLNSTASLLNSRVLHNNGTLQGEEYGFWIKRRISNTNDLFAGERAEWESPPSREIGSRPSHLEISYRNLCVIFLYPPQRICLDISLDLSKLCY